jgi:hypothetical protein
MQETIRSLSASITSGSPFAILSKPGVSFAIARGGAPSARIRLIRRHLGRSAIVHRPSSIETERPQTLVAANIYPMK